MKRIMAVLLTVLLLATFAIPAYAARPQTQLANVMKNQVNNLKKLEANKSREEVKAKLDALKLYLSKAKTLKNENLKLHKQNNALRKQLTAALRSMKKSRSMLSAGDLALLTDYQNQLKSHHVGIASTKGEIIHGIKNNRANVRNKDYTAIQAAYESIIATLTARNTELKSINDILSKMIALVKGAKPMAASAATVPTAEPVVTVTPNPTAVPVS